MTKLPRIPSPFGETVIPAVPEKRFPELYFVGLGCDIRPEAEHKTLDLVFREYNYDAEEFHPTDPDKIHHEDDLWAVKEEYPLVAQVMGGIISVGLLLISLRKAQAEGNVASVAAIETQLGKV